MHSIHWIPLDPIGSHWIGTLTRAATLSTLSTLSLPQPLDASTLPISISMLNLKRCTA
jgi:hypothetical protein